MRSNGRAGRKPQLSAEQSPQLEQSLSDGPEAHGYPTPLWTCQLVVHLIHKQFGIRYHLGHIRKILVRLGWSPQRPVGLARQRDEQAIRQWGRRTWPAANWKGGGCTSPSERGARFGGDPKRMKESEAAKGARRRERSDRSRAPFLERRERVRFADTLFATVRLPRAPVVA